jgi:hypothetical protein
VFIPVGWGQVNWKFAGVGAPTGAQVTLGFNHENFTDPIEACAVALQQAWVTAMLPRQSTQINLQGTLVKWGPNDTGPQAEVGSGATGGGSGQSETPQTAALVQKVTGVGGRQGRGRMYVPGIPETNFASDGSMSSGNQALWQTALNSLVTAMNAADLPPALLHSPAGPIVAPFPITGLLIQGKAATQRRRIRR